MIDTDGYRLNIGIVLSNQEGKLLWAKRVGQNAWQFPQGGMKAHESPEQAMFRELYEEVGLTQKKVKIIACTQQWLRYRLPQHLIRYHQRPLCIGQKQKWFLLRLQGKDSDINLTTSATPEFECWQWVEYWHPLDEVVFFKRKVYEAALAEFQPLVTQPSQRVAVF